MMQIAIIQTPLDKVRAENLKQLFQHPGFAVLRTVIASAGATAQVSASEFMMFPENPTNAMPAKDLMEQARDHAVCLEILDKLSTAQDGAITTATLTPQL